MTPWLLFEYVVAVVFGIAFGIMLALFLIVLISDLFA